MSVLEIQTRRQSAGLMLEHIVLGCIIFVACAAATAIKSPQQLSFFWIADALMLGLIVRFPVMAQPQGWAMAACGYLLGSYVGEVWLPKVLSLTFSNMTGVAAGWLYLRSRTSHVIDMRTPTGVLHLLVGVAIACVVGAALGGCMVQYLMQRPWQRTAVMWFGAEAMHMLLIVPLLLNAPPPRELRHLLGNDGALSILPLATLVTLMCVALYIGGPGAQLLVLPGLILCALSYKVFAVSLLCFLIGAWHVLVLVWAGFDFSYQNVSAAMSMRLGLAMLSVTMLTVACARSQWRETLQKLEHLSTHDHLTGMLNRAAFVERSQRALVRLAHDSRPVAMLMLDLDWFKKVNDTYGHLAGDEVLKAVSEAVIQTLRPNELLGRIGGEEFALLLQGVDGHEACATAERLCKAVRALALEQDDGQVLRPTISIGVAALTRTPGNYGLGQLLKLADMALYATKDNGRDGYSLSYG